MRTAETGDKKEIVDNEIAYRIQKRINTTLANAVRKIGKEVDYDIEQLACLLFDAAGTAAQWLGYEPGGNDHSQEIALYKLWRQTLSEHIDSARKFQAGDLAVDLIAAHKRGEAAEALLDKEGF